MEIGCNIITISTYLMDGHNHSQVIIVASPHGTYANSQLTPGANFTNRLKLSHLSLSIKLKPQNRLKSVREIGPWK